MGALFVPVVVFFALPWLGWCGWWASLAAALASLFAVLYIEGHGRPHAECSAAGCAVCADVRANGWHCSWCSNTRCNGQSLERCLCYCHTHKYAGGQATAGSSACTDPRSAELKEKQPRLQCACAAGSGCILGSCVKAEGGAGVPVHCACGVACAGEGPLYNFKKAFLLHSESYAWTSRPQTKMGKEVFDVVYAGGGLVNLMAAYHLLLNSRSQVRILLIDPRSKARDDPSKDFKVGESTLIPSSSMLFQHLGLHDWIIENCPPKHTLSWHWAKRPNDSNNSQQTDYYTIEEPSPTPIPTYQLNRAKLEAHLISLIEAKGGRYVRAHAKIDKLGTNGQMHSIKYLPVNQEQEQAAKAPSSSSSTPAVEREEGTMQPEFSPEPADPSAYVSCFARHLLDGTGRRFLLGKPLKLMVTDKAELFDIDNGSVWIRVAHPDYRNYIHGESGYLAGRPIWESSFYNTNHYMGPGYWIWVIPIETGGRREVSIGVSFHRQVYQGSQFNTQAKLLNFLQANHGNLYDVCTGPQSEILDFHFLPKLAHYAKRMVNPQDNWCIMGEAAFNADPFYSTGLVFASFQVLQANTLLLGKLAAVDSAMMQRYGTAYNEYQLSIARQLMYLIHQHSSQLGNGCAMSWRIFMESAWIGAGLAAWLGTWLLCPHFCHMASRGQKVLHWVQQGQHALLEEVVQSGRNCGWVDISVPGTINILGLDFFKHLAPLKLWHTAGMIHGQHNEFQKTNFFAVQSAILLYQAGITAVLSARLYGASFFTRPDAIKRIVPRILALLLASLLQQVLSIRFRVKQWARRVPPSGIRALHATQFNLTYKPPKEANPW